ncbi:flagellar hook protein FlgE [Xanthomonas sp. Kuri4-1]
MGFNTSLSGLRASNSDLNVTSNNIANSATTGFKESRAEFADVFQGSAYGLSSNAVGTGVRVADVAQQFKQGNIDTTGNVLDMAISGQGFFNVNHNGSNLYTRAGNFQVDANGYVVTPEGYNLQVFPPDETGTAINTGSMKNLQLLTTDSSPKSTSTVNIGATLPANATAPVTTPFNPTDTTSYNYSTSVSVYDSLGVSHVMSSYFVKTANTNEWQQYTTIDGNSVSATPTTLQFSNAGVLTSPASGKIALDGYTPSSGAGTLSVTLDLAGSSQYGESFSVNDLRQDGYASGRLTEFEVQSTGQVYARYSNGANLLMGQVALTNFNNEQGLQPQGNNCWGASAAAGTPRTGAPGSSDFGQVESGSLEASTVDLTEQLVNMIVAQRNFQANAKMITTQDEITQTVINIR